MQDIRFNPPTFNCNEAGLIDGLNSSNNANPLNFTNNSISYFRQTPNNPGPLNSTYTWNGKNGDCDTPTWRDNCLTIRRCTGLTNDVNCGWTTFGSKCGCSGWSWFNCAG